MKKLLFLLITTLLFSFSKSAFSQEEKVPLITLNTGSFLYHFVPKSNDDYTQFFNNRYLSIGVKITKKGYFSFGTMLNSHGDRMATIGFKTNLYTFSEKYIYKVFMHILVSFSLKHSAMLETEEITLKLKKEQV